MSETGISSTRMHMEGLGTVSKEVEGLEASSACRNPHMDHDFEPPPAPKLKIKGIIAMDITEKFTNAAKKLDVGQLIQDSCFTLFESVGALEIMDKKMDSGYLEPGEMMEDDYDFSQEFLPQEILGIMDQLLCHEMAWHMGHALAQTVFTSLHIDRLLWPCPLSIDETYFDKSESCSSNEPLMHRALRAYCLALIKTCFYVNTRVKDEHFYEVLLSRERSRYLVDSSQEEDFVTHTCHRSFLENVELDSILAFIEETATLINSDQMDADIKAALNSRLRFRLMFLKAADSADSRTVTNGKTAWTDLMSAIPEMKSTAKLAQPVASAFSAKLQRKLASTVPPRPIVEVSQDNAFRNLEKLCLDASLAVGVLEYFDSHSLLTFVMLFQARKPQPSVYVRTLLQYYIFGNAIILGNMSIRQLLDDDLATTVLPADLLLDRANDEVEFPSDPRFKIAARMEVFRSRAAESYLDILRVMCQNRCRIRRTLCHTIADWDNLQLDAEEIDQELRQYTEEEPILGTGVERDPMWSFPLSSWAYYYKIRQMEWIVQLGFELEIYQIDELASMYWYLQYLAKTRCHHLERIKRFVIHRHQTAQKKPRLAHEKSTEFTNALLFITFSNMEATATYSLADALSCLFTVLTRLSLIEVPSRPYSEDSMRHEVRMKPFHRVSLPKFIPFDEFTQLVAQPKEKTLELLEFAADSAAGAKKAFEVLSKLKPEEAFCRGSQESWLKDVKDCMKACIFTNITIAAVKKAVQVAGEGSAVNIKVVVPKVGDGYHDWWAVPKVVPIA